MTIGDKFKALRLALGLDQMAMAEQLYCSAAYLSQVEKGWCKPQHYLLERLNELYAIDPDEFGDESNRSYLPPGGIPARLRYTSPTRGNPKSAGRPKYLSRLRRRRRAAESCAANAGFTATHGIPVTSSR